MQYANRNILIESVGNVIAQTNIAVTDATTSTSSMLLAHPDTVTFTLSQASNVIIEFIASGYSSGGGALVSTVNTDGADDTLSSAGVYLPDTWSGYNIAQKKVSLSAGTHTIAITHFVTGGTGNWSNRQLIVTAVP